MKKLVIALLCLTIIDASAQEFSMKPKGTISDITVVVENLYSNLEIQGGTAGNIKIETNEYVPLPAKAAGLHPLSALGPDNSGIGLNITQSGTTVTISGTRRNIKDMGYKIMLPANIKLRINHFSFRSDDITIRGMKNEVDVKSQVGDLLFTDVTGPIIASTISSDIKVEFSSLNQSAPSSISSVSGDIDITLPQSSKGNFKLSSISGEIYTDLDFKQENKKDFPFGAGKQFGPEWGGKYSKPNFWGKQGGNYFPGAMSVNATLNDGGVDVTLRSVSGDIYIRKAKE